MGRRILRRLGAFALCVACAAYGFAVHKYHLFPFGLGQKLYQKFLVQHPPPGWRSRPPNTGTATSLGKITRLANLPYLRGYRLAEKAGVLVEERARMQDGWTLYTSGHAPVATLITSDGKVIHTWATDVATAFPGVVIPKEPEQWERYFSLAWLYPDGSIIAMYSHIGLVKLDFSSHVVWSYSSYVHHDVDVAPDGTIWVLSRRDRLVPGLGQGEPVVEDFAEQVSPEGKFIRRISVLDALRQSNYAALLNHVAVPGKDLLHTNSIRVLDGNLAAFCPAFRRGNLLISWPPMDAIAILDPDRGKIVWALLGQWHLQHAARLLPTGRLLMFDNLGSMRAASRALELDPFSQQISWSWGDRAGQDLFSESNGLVQRLENGNTLICETNGGRAIEVTREGDVVWEWVNPNRAGDKNELVAALYSIERVPKNVPALLVREAR
jgi:hypothetical protein